MPKNGNDSGGLNSRYAGRRVTGELISVASPGGEASWGGLILGMGGE
jgi:hypothetical protein